MVPYKSGLNGPLSYINDIIIIVVNITSTSDDFQKF